MNSFSTAQFRQSARNQSFSFEFQDITMHTRMMAANRQWQRRRRHIHMMSSTPPLWLSLLHIHMMDSTPPPWLILLQNHAMAGIRLQSYFLLHSPSAAKFTKKINSNKIPKMIRALNSNNNLPVLVWSDLNSWLVEDRRSKWNTLQCDGINSLQHFYIRRRCEIKWAKCATATTQKSRLNNILSVCI